MLIYNKHILNSNHTDTEIIIQSLELIQESELNYDMRIADLSLVLISLYMYLCIIFNCVVYLNKFFNKIYKFPFCHIYSLMVRQI